MRECESMMLRRHKEEFAKLRESCPHKEIGDWWDYYWAPGHLRGQCRPCTFCGKIMEKTWVEVSIEGFRDTGTGETVFGTNEERK